MPPDLVLDECPAGKYCLAGDVNPLPQNCPNGTFSPLTGLKSVSQCLDCPVGKFCSPPGLTAPVKTTKLMRF